LTQSFRRSLAGDRLLCNPVGGVPFWEQQLSD